MIFQLILSGHSSDQCRSRFGRRRPYIFGLGCLLIFSLMIIPYGEVVSTILLGDPGHSKALGVGMLIVGSVLLDFTSQAGLTPCEALLSDASRNTNQQERAFTVYSFMVSAGGCIGYLITALDWSSSAMGMYFGGQEQCAFSVLIMLFSVTLFATLLVAEENPVISKKHKHKPERNKEISQSSDDEQVKKTLDQIHQAIVRDKASYVLGPSDPGYETESNQSTSEEYQSSPSNRSQKEATVDSVPLLPQNGKSHTEEYTDNLRCPTFFIKKSYTIPLTKWTFTTFGGMCHLIGLKLYTLLPRSIKTLVNIPAVLKRLALANFCSWSAVMGFNLFFTDFVGQAVYLGNPNAAEDSHERLLYDEGVRMASWGLLLHCVTSAVYAAIVDRLVSARVNS